MAWTCPKGLGHFFTPVEKPGIVPELVHRSLHKGVIVEVHTHDWRVNPLQAVKSLPASLTAVCAADTCSETRQLGPRGWTMKRQPVSRWPRVSIDAPRAVDPDQLSLV